MGRFSAVQQDNDRIHEETQLKCFTVDKRSHYRYNSPGNEPEVRLCDEKNEQLSESPVITFVRGTALLAMLIVLPGIAVCWNFLPESLWSESVSAPVSSAIKTTQHFRQDAREPATVAPELVYSVSPEFAPFAPPAIQSANALTTPPLASPYPSIQQVSWELPRTGAPQDFESLSARLKELGATYSKLEHWGDGGELYRFSCFVSPSGARTFEKHFQSFGSDAVTAIQKVIADIEQWKN